MSPFDIIRSATTVNAELLNRSGELGVVPPGARADLIAVDGDPLAEISLLDGQGEHLTHIMKDGVFTSGPCKASPADHPPETAYPSKSAGGVQRVANVLEIFTAWKLLINNISHKFKFDLQLKQAPSAGERTAGGVLLSRCQSSYVGILTSEFLHPKFDDNTTGWKH